jgi:hypothetical protein
MNLRISFTSACLALLASASFAQSVPAPDAPVQDVQKRAEALMDKARQRSDIRSANAPAFRLKATFSFVGTGLETVEGTYTEVWVSNSQWRREMVAKDWRRIEVGGLARSWQLDNPEDFPEEAIRVPAMMSVFPSGRLKLEFESISDRATRDLAAECAYTRGDPKHHPYAFCFDKTSGVLLESNHLEVRPRNEVNYTCEYGTFHKFGDFWFPREVACFEDRHKKIEAKIVELFVEPTPDTALFTPPAGAIELGNCSGNLVPPHRVRRPEAVAPSDPYHFITVWFVVDVKGKPQGAKVLHPGLMNKAGYEKVLRTVRDWRFKPGTCNGEPMPMQARVEVPFSPSR